MGAALVARVLCCVGTLVRPCPTRATWTYGGRGASRKRCQACFTQDHLERQFLDRAVTKLGQSEADALVSLLLNYSKHALAKGNRAEALRLIDRARSGLVILQESAA